MEITNSPQGYEFSVNQKELWKLGANVGDLYSRIVIEISGPIDIHQLMSTCGSVIGQHEVFSSRCYKNDSSLFPLQVSAGKADKDWFRADVSGKNDAEIEAEADAWLDQP